MEYGRWTVTALPRGRAGGTRTQLGRVGLETVLIKERSPVVVITTIELVSRKI